MLVVCLGECVHTCVHGGFDSYVLLCPHKWMLIVYLCECVHICMHDGFGCYVLNFLHWNKIALFFVCRWKSLRLVWRVDKHSHPAANCLNTSRRRVTPFRWQWSKRQPGWTLQRQGGRRTKEKENNNDSSSLETFKLLFTVWFFWSFVWSRLWVWRERVHFKM